MKILVLGGVRSGKSRHAESLARAGSGRVTVIATATALDEEMERRIAGHRAARPAEWSVVEEPLYLATALAAVAVEGTTVIVDCLTLWLTNLMCQADASLLDAEIEALLALLPRLPGRIVMVANEVGLGVMPVNALARRFGDVAGTLHQQLAGLCDSAVLMVAGLPLALKGVERC